MPENMNRSFMKKKEETTQEAEGDTEDHVKEEQDNDALTQPVPFAPRRTTKEQTPPENKQKKTKGYCNWITTCDLVDEEGGETPPVKKKPRVVPATRSAEEIAQDPNIIIDEKEYTEYWLEHGCERDCKYCQEV